MPKAIKKKVKRTVKAEEGLKGIVQGTREFVSERQRLILPILAILIISAIAAAGLFIYKSNVNKKAEAIEYEAYRIYYGLDRNQPPGKEDRYQRALERFREAYEKRRSPFSLFYIASCYYDMGRYDDSLKTLKELNERFPDDERFVPLSYYKMAMISVRKGDKETALKLLDTIYNYRTGSFKDLALMESARILNSMGKTDEALKRYEDLVKNFPGSPFLAEAQTGLGGKGVSQTKPD